MSWMSRSARCRADLAAELESLVAALAHHPRATGLPFTQLLEHSDYWEAVRAVYQPFESGMKASAADVYIHEIPGGQYSNLRPQAESVGVGDRLPELKRMYQTVNQLLGDIVKVTPSSKMVGDLALFMLTNDLTPQDLIDRGRELAFPESVVGYFAGDIGQPPAVSRRRCARWCSRAGARLLVGPARAYRPSISPPSRPRSRPRCGGR